MSPLNLVLILDNYIIHKSRAARRWLAKNPKFELLFQPVYYPWVNVIERLWKAMHDTITRNHQCTNLPALLERVVHFLDSVQPFRNRSTNPVLDGQGACTRSVSGSMR